MVANQRSNFSMVINFAFAIRYNIERLNSFRGPGLNIVVGWDDQDPHV